MAKKTYNITLTANHQSLTAEYLPLAAESVQYLTAKVVCETEDWTGREIKVLFGQGCTVYEIPVTGGEITAKQQLNLTAGDWRVWLVGNSARDGEVIPRITTNVAHISVAPTGGTEGNPFPAIPPTVEEQLRADMGNLADLTTEDKSSLVAAINEAAASGGSKDAVTYTPQTLTEEQKSQARTNIGAGQPLFVVNVTTTLGEQGDEVYTADKTAAEIETAYQAGCEIVCRTSVPIIGMGLVPSQLPLKSRRGRQIFMFAIDQTIWTDNSSLIVSYVVTIAYDGVSVGQNNTEIYIKPASGIPKSDLAEDVQTSLDKADTAISLGLTTATPGQIIKVKTVQDGKPTEWEAVNPDYTLTVTISTKDGVTVTGQTVTVRAGDADGPIYNTAEYNGQPVSFRVADGFAYFVEVTDNLAAHFMPTTVKGVINGANAAVTLLYNDLSTIQTASDIQAALDADMDLTEIVGQQITCQRGNDTLSWDVVDYDSTAKVVTLCMHDVLPDAMQFEPPQALMYCEDGLTAGSYTFKQSNAQYYFTLTQAIPAGGQLRATTSAFQTYESKTATTQIESGKVSTKTIDGATNLGETGTGNLNHHDRVKYGSNNFGESSILQWLNSDSPADTPMPGLTKFSRPYVSTKAGFKADLDAEFLACIQDTTWKCSANNLYECPVSLGGIAQKGNPYTVTAKFVLASEIEVFGEYGGVQDGGTVWGLYVDAEATDRIKYYNNTVRAWWLRSPNETNAATVRSVNTSGVGFNRAAQLGNWVAVACKIAKSKADLSDISYDISLGLTSATPGQIIKVKTVQDGKPTEWEAVDMPSGSDEWELIAHINVADDVEKDVTVWEYNNLPRYKYIAYKKVNLVGSGDQTASGCTIKINNESSQPSGMTYGKSGFPQNCIGMIYVMPFGWTHYKTVDATSPDNIALGGFNAMLTALPLSDNAITSITLSAHTVYKIASGEIWLYGKKG